MQEQWSPVWGFEDFYEASDQGRLRRIQTQGGKPSGRINRPGSRRGYLNYTLSVDNVQRTFSAHRLVWEAFNGPIAAGLVINHKNGDKRDNRLANLEVCTPSENNLHAIAVLGHVARPPLRQGEGNGRAKISAEAVAEIRRLRAEGWTQQKLADRFGIHQTGISALLRGLTWRSAA